MRRFSFIAVIVLTMAFAGQALAEAPKVKVVMGDGSIFYGVMNSKKISIDTDFGKLTVPVTEINKLTVGNKRRGKVKDFIVGKLKELAGTLNEDQREKLMKDVQDVGFAGIPLLEDIALTNEDQSSAIEDIISGIEIPDYVDQDLLNYEDDRIIAGESSIAGAVKNDSLSVNSSLGTVNLNISKIYSITFYQTGKKGNAIVKTIKLPANKYIAAKEQLKTKIFINKGDRVKIKATGSIVLASLSNKTFYPKGDNYSGSWQGFPFGALCGRIGDSNPWFLIGDMYKGVSQYKGYLWLTISETLFNASNTGEYKIRVEVTRK